ncbi:MAG: heavy-metal-associated domain-containing protein [Rubrivivax sp.]
MIAFEVNDMTCGHCVSTIAKALQGVDKDARVTIDLAKHLVMVEPIEADAHELGAAIAEAGYTPVPVQTTTVDARPAKAATGCCGSGP